MVPGVLEALELSSAGHAWAGESAGAHHRIFERSARGIARLVQLDVLPTVVLTLVNVLLALLPSAVIDATQTTIMSASMTAYSTAVGPSSRLKKSLTNENI